MGMIPAEAVEAAAKVWIGEEVWRDADESWRAEYLDSAREILEAAAPHMLSHEREQTRLAQVDVMVNRDTKAGDLAAEYRRGYRDGLADRKQVTK